MNRKKHLRSLRDSVVAVQLKRQVAFVPNNGLPIRRNSQPIRKRAQRERTPANMSLTHCRFYEEKFPEIDSFVMVNVRQVRGEFRFRAK